jgi:hypothetical protein
MLSVVRVPGWVVTSIDRTAYPRFKRLITAHELRGAAAAADAGYPENEGLVIDPETGIRR